MKRLSRKIRKRFSLSSQDRRNSAKDILNTAGSVTQSRQLPIPQSVYICSLNGEGDDNRRRNRVASEPASNVMHDSLDHHDYSTLDGEEDDSVLVSGENPHNVCQGIQNADAKSDPSDPVPSGLLAIELQCDGEIHMDGSMTSPPSPMLMEFEKLARQGWYWGPMTREQAEKRLSNAAEASFLVRDSSDDRYILSLSFRSHHRTLHTRIAHSGMKFSFYEDNPKQTYTSVVELIENSMRDTNEQGVFCYSRSRQPHAPTFPVRLLHPVSRFTEVRPLQDLCRFVIRRLARVDHIQSLPLPKPIKEYLHHSYF